MLTVIRAYRLRDQIIHEVSVTHSTISEKLVNGQSTYLTNSQAACAMGRHNGLRINTRLPAPICCLDEITSRQSIVLQKDCSGNYTSTIREWTDRAQQDIGSQYRHETKLVNAEEIKEVFDEDLHHIKRIVSEKTRG